MIDAANDEDKDKDTSPQLVHGTLLFKRIECFSFNKRELNDDVGSISFYAFFLDFNRLKCVSDQLYF